MVVQSTPAIDLRISGNVSNFYVSCLLSKLDVKLHFGYHTQTFRQFFAVGVLQTGLIECFLLGRHFFSIAHVVVVVIVFVIFSSFVVDAAAAVVVVFIDSLVVMEVLVLGTFLCDVGVGRNGWNGLGWKACIYWNG